MKINSSLLLAATLSMLAMLSSNTAVAQEEAKTTDKQEHKSYRASKKVPAMRNRVYTQLARAQKLADEGKKLEGFQVLDEVKGRLTSLNKYEQAMLYNFYGFMHYADDNLPRAIESFNQVISDESTIPDSLLISTRYSLAQLLMQQQDYKGALKQLLAWEKANGKALTANQEMLFAQVYYQDKDFVGSLMHIENAMKIATEENKQPKENWLILKRATHYELNQPEAVTTVMEQLVRLYDKPKYWLQLSGMYGEIGEEEKQVAVMEAAYHAGYITKEADIIMLAQLYQFHGTPYKAAKILHEAMEQGAVVVQEKNLDLLARSYLNAKESNKAVKILDKLTLINEGGQYEALLAQLYINSENWQQAIMAAGKAIKKSVNDKDTSYLGNMYLAKGMANFNLKQFDASLVAFSAAEKLPKLKKTAQQWQKYVEREQVSYQRQQAMRLAMLN
jgi:tetratricopeptide (TPR) repeat protein